MHLVQLSGQSKTFVDFSTLKDVHSHALPALKVEGKDRRLRYDHLFIYIFSAFSFFTIFFFNFRTTQSPKVSTINRQILTEDISINLCVDLFYKCPLNRIEYLCLYFPFVSIFLLLWFFFFVFLCTIRFELRVFGFGLWTRWSIECSITS